MHLACTFILPSLTTPCLLTRLISCVCPGAIEALFTRFDAALREAGYPAMSGQIIDAATVQAPRRRLTEAEKAAVKQGLIPEDWRAKPKKLAQKDRDARRTIERKRARRRGDGRRATEIGVPVFGYKSHISMDRRHGLIRKWAVGDAAEHDSRHLHDLLDEANTASPVRADTAYRSAGNERHLERHGFVSKVHFRKPPRRSLTGVRAKANAARSEVRSEIEPVFAAHKARMSLFIRAVGMARARARIGLANLAHNLTRFVRLDGRAAPA